MQDITRQIGIALRWLPLIVVGALAGALLAFAYASSQSTVYESTARLFVDPGPDPSVQDLAVAEAAAIRYADQAESRPVALAVIKKLELDEGHEKFQKRISTEVSKETLEVVINARAGDPAKARTFAQAVGNEMRQRVRDSLITEEVKAADAAIAANQANIKTLQNRLDNLRRKPNKNDQDRSEMIALPVQISVLQRDIQYYQPSSRAFVRNRLEWSERPTLPDTPVAPRPLYFTLLGFVGGAMLAAGLAFVLEYLRNHGKIRDEQDLETATGLLALGTVIESKRDAKHGDSARLAVLRYPKSDAAEAYRGLLGRIGFAGGTARTLLVASAGDTGAKSVVAANLALAYAEAGRNVILVDADHRSPRMHSFFGVRNDRGLTTVLADGDVPLGWVTVATSHPRLGLMPAGPPPTEVSDPLGSPQLATLLRRLLHAADMVVFDSPSMAGNLDAAVLATQLQESLLVVNAGADEQEAEDAARALHGAEADVIGVVLYRQVRRSRRGQRGPIVPPPAGRGSQPAPSLPRRIPVAIARPAPSSASDLPDPQASRAKVSPTRPQTPGQTATVVPPVMVVPPRPAASTNGSSGPAPHAPAGPYNVPFEPEKTGAKKTDE